MSTSSFCSHLGSGSQPCVFVSIPTIRSGGRGARGTRQHTPGDPLAEHSAIKVVKQSANLCGVFSFVVRYLWRCSNCLRDASSKAVSVSIPVFCFSVPSLFFVVDFVGFCPPFPAVPARAPAWASPCGCEMAEPFVLACPPHSVLAIPDGTSSSLPPYL